MQFVDAHCHLHFPRIASVVSSLMQNAKEQGVRYFAVNATSPQDFGLVDAIAASYPKVIPFYGIHPYYLSEETWEAAFADLVKRKDTLRYIGEIGMDSSNFYYSSFVIKGIIDMILLMNRSSTFEFHQTW